MQFWDRSFCNTGPYDIKKPTFVPELGNLSWYVEKWLMEFVLSLFRCMIMDNNGNVNLHTDFIEKPGDIEGQHIVKKVLQY